MKKMGKVARLASLLVLTLLFGLFPIGSGNNLNKVQAVTPLNNPITLVYSSFNANQKVKCYCVLFGEYPQIEVTIGDIYNKLKNATGWDENNDIVIDGNKYRRLKGEDATYYNTKRVLNYYDWIEDYSLKDGNYDITAVDRELAEIIPSPLDMGAVYQRLIRDTMDSKEDYVDGIMRVYNDEICDVIDNYNCSAFYEPSYVIARAYQNGGF